RIRDAGGVFRLQRKAQRIDQRHKIKPSVLTVHVLYRVEPGNYLPLRDNIPKATTKHSGNRW
ncbi:hypothetical protein, partial [Klebsiella aerogenes]|uniref:hypothetical protein n=1 Tax=Klebsiella aerogenes TaxID=548 RepID=UPI001BD1695C